MVFGLVLAWLLAWHWVVLASGSAWLLAWISFWLRLASRLASHGSLFGLAFGLAFGWAWLAFDFSWVGFWLRLAFSSFILGFVMAWLCLYLGSAFGLPSL